MSTASRVVRMILQRAEKTVVSRYVESRRGYPLSEAEWRKYYSDDFDIRKAYAREKPEGYAGCMQWWLDQCEIAGPEGGWRAS